jgi:hypothetical protein
MRGLIVYGIQRVDGILFVYLSLENQQKNGVKARKL